MAEPVATLQVRYDGLDADNHEIDLLLLGESLRGLSRVLSVAGHFAITGRYAKQKQALEVRVLVREPKANCFSIQAVLDFAKQHQILSGTGLLIGPLIAWIFARASNNRHEMDALKENLNNALALLAGKDNPTIDRLISTIERMTDSLRPSLRDAVAPLGRTCTHMRIGDGNRAAVVDVAAAEAIRSDAPDEITEERAWNVIITEMDLETSSAKVRFVDDEEPEERRIRAVITDPALGIQGNAYASAFISGAALTVIGKAALRDGIVQTLYISNNTQKP